jgi:hypothetical protein
MKFLVRLAFEVDSFEYLNCPPTELGVRELVQAMIQDKADLPDLLEVGIREAEIVNKGIEEGWNWQILRVPESSTLGVVDLQWAARRLS